jgi:hypothetical protein
MACCPDGIYRPLIIDCSGTVVPLPPGSTILGAPTVNFVNADGTVHLPTLSDAGRPAAGTAGRLFFNTTDGNLNIDDGTNWILPDGTTT